MFKLLLICCYLPCDSRTQDVSNDFRECCDAIEVFMSKQSYAACVIGGDLNVEIMRQTGNSKYILNFVENNNMQFLWNLDVDYTYKSYDGASSVIDHFVMSNEVAYAVCKGCVVHDVDNLSNHNPIVMECKFDKYGVHSMISNDKCVGNANLSWERASHEDLESYRYYVDKLLRCIDVPSLLYIVKRFCAIVCSIEMI